MQSNSPLLKIYVRIYNINFMKLKQIKQNKPYLVPYKETKRKLNNQIMQKNFNFDKYSFIVALFSHVLNEVYFLLA